MAGENFSRVFQDTLTENIRDNDPLSGLITTLEEAGYEVMPTVSAPSSKMCSSCRSIKKDLKLSDRIYICECGLVIDRDKNASINLSNYKLV